MSLCTPLAPSSSTTSSSSECSSYGGFSSSEAESSQHRRLRPIRTSVAASTAATGVRGARARVGEEEGRRQHLRQAEGPPQAARRVIRGVPQHHLERQARAVGVAWGGVRVLHGVLAVRAAPGQRRRGAGRGASCCRGVGACGPQMEQVLLLLQYL